MYLFPHPRQFAFTEENDSAQQKIFKGFLYSILSQGFVDEEWYLSEYPDVRPIIEAGDLASALDHYSRSGYFEGRFPFRINVDEGWYLATYPDVAQAVRAGRVVDATAHFFQSGYADGRLPYAMPVDPTWYLAAYPVAALRINKKISSTAAEDFLRYGYRAGFTPFRLKHKSDNQARTSA